MTRRLDVESYVAALRRDGAALAKAAKGRLDLAVPPCPEWSVADLVWHTGEVHDFWRQIAERKLQRHDDAQTPARPPDGDLLAWYEDGVERLASVLETADPAIPTWSWAPEKNVGFIQRRMAQETVVHRADAEISLGRHPWIEPRLAADGIDEFFEFFFSDEECREPGESISLRATDVDATWLVTVAEGGFSVAHGDGLPGNDADRAGDAGVRAAASDLLLLLWRRRGSGDLDVSGDPIALERFLSRADLT